MLVKAIVRHELPFNFVEFKHFRSLFSYLDHRVQPISRNTAKSDVLKLYLKEKRRLKSFLSSIPGRVSLTSDLWTSITTDGYISLTAHFIDDDWKIQKKLLNFSLMLPPHTGVAICEKIYNLLVDWGIEKKLFCVTLDNASANKVFIDLLKNQLKLKHALLGDGELFHVRCCAHVLNLIVADGLKVIDASVTKIRESVKYLRGSQVRKQKFLECIAYVSLDSKRGLRQDVPTRWNSTFLMLESALYYRLAFIHLELVDSNYTNCPSQEEWDKVQKIAGFLDNFHKSTCMFSGTAYPTSNLFFSEVFFIEHHQKMAIEDGDPFIKSMAKVMYEKFDKYWKEYNLMLAIACVLDPRYKIQFVEFAFKKLYGVGSEMMVKVKEKLLSLYDEYAGMWKSEGSPKASMASSEVEARRSSPYSRLDIFEEFGLFEGVEFGDNSHKTQLQLYLEECRVNWTADYDILTYLKTNQSRFPVLALMARDVLAVPMSTVASESAFSTGGRILDQFRSALKPKNVEALVCMRDWSFGKGMHDVGYKLEELTEDIMALNIHKASSQINSGKVAACGRKMQPRITSFKNCGEI